MRLFVSVTGGGTKFISDFMAVPGASSTIVGANIPYNQAVFDKLAGKPDSYSSSEAALKLAVYSHNESLDNSGIGAVFSLAKENERVNRTHSGRIALHNKDKTRLFKAQWEQGWSRGQEEQFCSDLLLDFTANEINLKHEYNKPPGFTFSEKTQNSGIYSILNTPNQIVKHNITTNNGVFFPGSFNPWHDGHQTISNIAENYFNTEVIREISIKNVDKPMLDWISIHERVNKQGNIPFIISNTSKFVDKLEVLKKHFNNVTFVVGADTWRRVLSPLYNTPQDLENLKTVNFMAFGRDNEDIPDAPNLIKYKEALSLNIPLSSSNIRKSACNITR